MKTQTITIDGGNLAMGLEAMPEGPGAEKLLDSIPNEKWSLALRTMSGRTTAYHRGAKTIDQDKAAKVADSLPFLPHLKQMAARGIKGLDEAAASDDYLRSEYGHLGTYDVAFSVAEFNQAEEQARIDKVLASFERSGMKGMVDTVGHDYRRFAGIRQLMQEGALKTEGIIPVECLPELLLAAPVWFFKANAKFSIPDNFCDKPRREFSWLFQLYNHHPGQSPRPFANFNGKDVIPPKLAAVIEQASEIFDCLVIATPYHHLTDFSSDWTANVDPFLVGFIQDASHFYVLGRWSGTGIMPRVCEMIADTLEHLETNLPAISNLETDYWRNIKRDHTPLLEKFIKDMLASYDSGRLIDYFKGYRIPVTSPVVRAITRPQNLLRKLFGR